MPYIIGSPINAYCAACKTDTEQVVLEITGIQVREVMCKKCGQKGSFLAPHNRLSASKPRSASKSSTSKAPRKRASKSPAVVFAELMEGRDSSEAMPYSVSNSLKEGNLINHPQFGVGIVTDTSEPRKAKVVFPTGERIMVCDRK